MLAHMNRVAQMVEAHYGELGLLDRIKEALLQIAPEEKASIEASKFGEIKGS